MPSSPQVGAIVRLSQLCASYSRSFFPGFPVSSQQFRKKKPGSKDALNSLEQTKAGKFALEHVLIDFLFTLNKIKTAQ